MTESLLLVGEKFEKYHLGGNNFRYLAFAGPHYTNHSGEWAALSNRLFSLPETDSDIGQTFDINSAQASHYLKLRAKRGMVAVRNWRNQKFMVIEPQSANAVDPVIESQSLLLLPQVWTGVDYRVQMTRTGVKSTATITTSAGQRKIRFKLSGTSTQTLEEPFYMNGNQRVVVPAGFVSAGIYEMDLTGVPVGTVVDPSATINATNTREGRASSGTWLGARNSATATDYVVNNVTTALAYVSGPTTFYCARTFFNFDTSSVGSGMTVSAGTINTQILLKNAGSVTFTTYTGANPMISANFGSVGTTELVTRRTAAGMTINIFNAFTLNASGLAAINVTGNTPFVSRGASRDFDNVSPTGDDDWVNAAGEPDTGDPYLDLTYSAPAGGGSSVSNVYPFAGFLGYPCKWR